MEDQRAFPRLSLACEIEFNISAPDSTETTEKVKSKTKDISQGGICLITTSPLKEGDILNLKIRLLGEETPFKVKGRVIWIQMFEIGNQKGYDNGIEFIEIPEDNQSIIESFLKRMFSI